MKFVETLRSLFTKPSPQEFDTPAPDPEDMFWPRYDAIKVGNTYSVVKFVDTRTAEEIAEAQESEWLDESQARDDEAAHVAASMQPIPPH